MSKDYTVSVPEDLKDLVPTFLANRAKEIESLRAALAKGDMAQLKALGHRMKGVGVSYGFDKVSELGKRIEDHAETADKATLEACLAEYADYMSKVQVTYV